MGHLLQARHWGQASLACVRRGAPMDIVVLRMVYRMVRRPGCKSNQNQWKSNETNANFIMFFAMIIQWPHYHASLANDRGCSGKTWGCGCMWVVWCLGLQGAWVSLGNVWSCILFSASATSASTAPQQRPSKIPATPTSNPEINQDLCGSYFFLCASTP